MSKYPTAPNASRRTFLKTTAGAGFATALGLPIPFQDLLPNGIVPVALAQSNQSPNVFKPGLTVLNDRPLNIETPAHLLDDAITPAARMFVRNNGLPPAEIDSTAWRLEIDGEVETPLSLSIADLQSQFETRTLQLQIECAGNGRRFMKPAARGNQWSFGAISCGEWTGVSLRDILLQAGLKDNAVYTAHYGADTHLSGDPEKYPLSRGIPIEKALEPHTIVAFALNGSDMPVHNGHPLRIVAPGWPGSCSQKWLTRIEIRDRVHDGAKMTGQSYRVPAYPVAPGIEVADDDMEIIQSLPVKSLITAPQTGVRFAAGELFNVRGHAWAGDADVDAVDISIDFGASWIPAALSAPANKYAWQQWSAEVRLPEAGYYEVWARAKDANGKMQPPVPPGWNPRGYLNNMQHRIAVFAL